MAEQVMVGIGEVKVSSNQSSVLIAYGLGSCVGVCLYDPAAKVGGLAHVMLPDSLDAQNQHLVTRFADRAVPLLLEQLTKLGANARRVTGKIAGGASMLNGSSMSDHFNVGERNVAAVRAALNRLGVPVVAADVGGNRGRTMTVDLGSGQVFVRKAGEKDAAL